MATCSDDNIKLSSEDSVNKGSDYCEPCQANNTKSPASHICDECEETLCESCSSTHRVQKATKNHHLRIALNKKHVPQDCEPCTASHKTFVGRFSCSVCDEILCEKCATVHRSQKATKSHDLTEIKHVEENDKNETSIDESHHTTPPIEPRDDQQESTIVADKVFKCVGCSCDRLCIDCKIAFCLKCMKAHTDQKENKKHKFVNIKREDADDTKGFESFKDSTRTLNKNIPGKPKEIISDTKADSLKITWKRPSAKFQFCKYQIRYQEQSDGIWKFHVNHPDQEIEVIRNLKSDVKYIFQVRMINNDKEGPYSEQSDVIKTTKSSADRIVEFTTAVQSIGQELILRRVPLTELPGTRNTTGKTRKFEFGPSTQSGLRASERTIMLVGETGSGKSTLVDGIVNYVLGVNWADRYRFTLVDLEDDEKGRFSNQAISQTQWITSYAINFAVGNRIDFKLSIIDTPGFGDTKGIERDQQIVDQIRELFTSKREMGVQSIDAICFLIKAPDARLTPTQKYIFNAILSLFGQDIEENLCILVTFADGKSPPVLAALDEAKLPHDLYFPFNNSGLFAENSGSKMSTLSPMFWEMGYTSFKSFFDHLGQMETKSLNQTKTVLCERRKLELTIENLQPLVDVGLNKLEELHLEKMILERHKSDIDANKDFHYSVVETKQVKHDLEIGKHVTNCLNCHVTCHKDCKIPNDEDKMRCWAMDSDGCCTQCIEKCLWNIHANTPYIFEFVQEEVLKTYAEKEEKYRLASGEKMTHEKVIDRMADELYSLEDEVMVMMSTVNKSNNVLRKIALRPNPLSIKEHIDLLIESEKLEKRTGFLERIVALQRFQKKTLDNVGLDVAKFQKAVGNVRQTTPKRPKSSVFGRLKFW